MKKVLVSLVLSGSLISGAFAAANTNTGCGLGSYLIDKQGILWNIFQYTLNNSSGTQTFGISSGTLGCKSGKVAMDSRTQEFVSSNMDALSQEIAQGKGEHLDTLAELLNIADKEAFGLALQANYNKLYTNHDAQSADVLDGIATL